MAVLEELRCLYTWSSGAGHALETIGAEPLDEKSDVSLNSAFLVDPLCEGPETELMGKGRKRVVCEKLQTSNKLKSLASKPKYLANQSPPPSRRVQLPLPQV